MTEPDEHSKSDLVFTIDAAMLPALGAWKQGVDEKVPKDQVRTGLFFSEHLFDQAWIQVVKESLERGDPKPYYGMTGGAYTYSFSPTSIGCVIRVSNTETGDVIDLTNYHEW